MNEESMQHANDPAKRLPSVKRSPVPNAAKEEFSQPNQFLETMHGSSRSFLSEFSSTRSLRLQEQPQELSRNRPSFLGPKSEEPRP